MIAASDIYRRIVSTERETKEGSDHSSNVDEEADVSGTWTELQIDPEKAPGFLDKMREASLQETSNPKVSWKDKELFQDKDTTYLVSAENIAQQIMLKGDESIVVDHLFYDVSQEGDEAVVFHLWQFLEDVLINLLMPISHVYVWFRYGYWGLQMRGMAPPPGGAEGMKDHDEFHHHHDPDEPKWQPPGIVLFIASNLLVPFRVVWLTSFFMGGYASLKSGDGIARAPFYHFSFAVLIHAFFNVSLSMKKAFRKKSSIGRLHLHRERRSEELFFGWLPLPWNVALFQIRLANYMSGNMAIEREYITFDGASVEEMREAIGSNILHIVDRGGLQAIKPIEEEEVDEKTGAKALVTRAGSKVSMLAFLLRLALDNSFASPPFGKAADGMYMDVFASSYWSLFIVYQQLLPYIVDNTARESGSYNGWSISLIITSAFIIWFYGDGPPQGWTYSAIVTLSRKRDMLAFLNALLTDRMPEASRKTMFSMREGDRKEWTYLMDLSRVANLSRWQTMRDVVMRFDTGYRSRTDGNGAVIMIYIAIFTLFLLLGTVLINGRLGWSDYAYYFLMHISLLLPMGIFAATMSLQGDACNDVADQSKLALTLGMVQLEEKHETGKLSHDQSERVPAARFAATQLQEALSAASRLYSVQMLQVIDLNRTLVISIIFAVVTQITLLLENIDFRT